MPKPRISDHALLRWLERVHDQDLNAEREKLEALVQSAVDARVKHIQLGGWWFVFEGPLLVTILPEKPGPNSLVRHDRGAINGSGQRDGDPHWKFRNRKRNHV